MEPFALEQIKKELAELRERVELLENPCKDEHDWGGWGDGTGKRVCTRNNCDEVDICGTKEQPHNWVPIGCHHFGDVCARCNIES
jgi:O-succinylbenzoate synthase